jgi:hypothetical protein
MRLAGELLTRYDEASVPGTVLGSKSPFRKSGPQDHYQIMDYQTRGDCRDRGRWLKKPLNTVGQSYHPTVF